MKKLIILSVALLMPLYVFSQCADPENVYQFEYNNKTYEVIKEAKNWADASACCVARGGYLVEINNMEEQDSVLDAILNQANVSPTYVNISNGGGIAYVWIGATDALEEGKWLWDGDNDGEGVHFWTGQGANGSNDGVALDTAYVNWGGKGKGTINEPDDFGGDGQDRAAIGLTGWPSGTTLLGDVGEWNDIIGTSEIYYVVEYDSIDVTGLDKAQIPADNPVVLQVYPNPSSGIIHVVAEDIVSIETFDIMGRRQGSFLQSPLDLSQYQKGAYFIRIRTLNSTSTRKIFLE